MRWPLGGRTGGERVLVRVARPIVVELVEARVETARGPRWSARIVVAGAPPVEIRLERNAGAPFDGAQLVVDAAGERLAFRVGPTWPWRIAYLLAGGGRLLDTIPVGDWPAVPAPTVDWAGVARFDRALAVRLACDGQNAFGEVLRAAAGDDLAAGLAFLDETFAAARVAWSPSDPPGWDAAFRALPSEAQAPLRRRMRQALVDGAGVIELARATAHLELADLSLRPSLVARAGELIAAELDGEAPDRGRLIVRLLDLLVRFDDPRAGALACALYRSYAVRRDETTRLCALAALKRLDARCPEARADPAWSSTAPLA